MIPLETEEQQTVAEYLDFTGLLWLHIPNERKAKPQYIAKLKRLGMKPGAPDILIFVPTPCGNFAGLAIELKRRKGGVVSDNQKEWLQGLRNCEWKAVVCKGADEAIQAIEETYGV